MQGALMATDLWLGDRIVASQYAGPDRGPGIDRRRVQVSTQQPDTGERQIMQLDTDQWEQLTIAARALDGRFDT
jgi:hypothetical protein